jgi:hypothetical protein
MWARRLVGEALSQAGRVAAADHGALTALIAAHTARMAAVGLNN